MPSQVVGGYRNALLTAALSTTTIFTTKEPGLYRLTWYCKKVAADGAASTTGPLTVAYTEVDTTAVSLSAPAIVVAGTVATTNATDSATQTGVLLGLPIMLNCAAASVVSIAMAYSSTTPGNMKYNLHVTLERWDYN